MAADNDNQTLAAIPRELRGGVDVAVRVCDRCEATVEVRRGELVDCGCGAMRVENPLCGAVVSVRWFARERVR